MKSKIRKIVSRSACAAALAAVGGAGLGACGAEGGAEVEHVAQVADEIGVSCAGHASTVASSGFDQAYTSAATYSDCYRGKVVQINDYSQSYAVGGYTEVRWGDTTISRAACTGSYVSAYLFERQGSEWVFVKQKSAHGDLRDDDIESDVELPPKQLNPGGVITRPITPGDLGGPVSLLDCIAPRVFFHTSDMTAGRSYQIAATARFANNTIKKVTFRSYKGRCGQEADAKCCLAGEPCVGGLTCDSRKECAPCGARGELCCAGSGCNDNLTCEGNKCVECGARGELCCAGSSCNDNLTCEGNKCVDCGARGEACCSGNNCDSGLTCSGGVCVSCGSSGQACCDGGSSCDNGLTCQSGVCKKPVAPAGGLLAPCRPNKECDDLLACLPSLNPDVLLCLDPSAPCSTRGENCCLGLGSGAPPYCDNRYYSRLTCNFQTRRCED